MGRRAGVIRNTAIYFSQGVLPEVHFVDKDVAIVEYQECGHVGHLEQFYLYLFQGMAWLR